MNKKYKPLVEAIAILVLTALILVFLGYLYSLGMPLYFY